MPQKPTLTIAIPTYNRSKNLEIILKQLKEQYDESFEILVGDDTSPDDTSEMLERYTKEMTNLKYFTNEENLGFSGNVCKLYETADTRYIWYLCDDDEVTEGAVKTIQYALNTYEPVVAVFNHLHVDPYGRKMNAGVTEDVIYEDLDKIDDYQPIMRTTFLSTLVLERRLSIDKIKTENYKDNVYVQVTMALHLLSDKFKFAEFAFPIVDRHVGFKYGDFFKFYMVDHLKAVNLIETAFEPQKFVDWSIRDMPNALKLYYSQKLGLYTYQKEPTQETKTLLKKYYGTYSFIIFVFYYLYKLVPTVVLKSVYFLKLVSIHGYSKAKDIYKSYIDRAYRDERQTGFTSYR